MDFLSQRITSIRNAQNVGLRKIEYNFSENNFTFSTQDKNYYIIFKSLELLRREGFIRGYSYKNTQVTKKNISKKLNIYLKYDVFGNKVINSIIRVSTPGRRVYLSASALWQPQSTTGLFILSTTQGLRTDTEARRYNLGGEVLFGIT